MFAIGMFGTLLMATPAFAVDAPPSHYEAFDDLSGWTAASSGGSSFKSGAHAGHAAADGHAQAGAAYVAVDGGAGGSDWGFVWLTKTFDVHRLDEIRLSYRLESQGGPSPFHVESGVYLIPRDAGGEQLGQYGYIVAGDEGAPHNTDAPTIVKDRVAADGQWRTMVANPAQDFGIDWGRTFSIEVQLRTSAGFTLGNSHIMLYDDLTLVDGATGVAIGSGEAPVETPEVSAVEFSTPGVPAQHVVTPGLTLPAACSPGNVVCVSSIVIPPQHLASTPPVDEQSISTPGLGPQHLITLPGARIALQWGEPEFGLDPALGETEPAPATVISVPLFGEDVQITLCGSDACPLPVPPSASARGELQVTLVVGDLVARQTVPVSAAL